LFTGIAIFLIVAFGIAAFSVFIAEWKLAQDLVRFRTDIGPKQGAVDGRSFFIQLNISNPANYRPEGLPGLRRLKRLAMIRLTLTGLVVVTFVWAFVLR